MFLGGFGLKKLSFYKVLGGLGLKKQCFSELFELSNAAEAEGTRAIFRWVSRTLKETIA